MMAFDVETLKYDMHVEQVRAFLVGHAGRALAQAATIATRYSIVRRQGFRQEASKAQQDTKTHPEHQVRMPFVLSLHE